MATTLTYDNVLNDEISQIVIDIRNFVSNIQTPNIKDINWKNSVQEYCDDLTDRINEICNTIKDKKSNINAKAFEEIADNLSAYKKELYKSQNVKRLQLLYSSLSTNYEIMIETLQKSKVASIINMARASHLKPINYTRNMFHIGMGLGSAALYHYLLSRGQAILLVGLFVAFVTFVEVSRRLSKKMNDFFIDKMYKSIVRPFERHKISSATFFLAALFILAIFFPKPSTVIALITLALADPAASITGKLWGKKKLYKDKSYLGTTVFFSISFLATLIFFAFSSFSFSFFYMLFGAFFIAAVSTLSELFATRLDDNFTIPIMCAIAATIII